MKKVVFCATVLLSGVAFGMGNLEEGRPLLPSEQKVSSCNCYRVVAYTALTAVSAAAGACVPWYLFDKKLWMIAGGAAGAFVGGGLTWLGDRIYIYCSSRKNREQIEEAICSINDVPVVSQERSDLSAGEDTSDGIATIQSASVNTDLVVHQGGHEQADLSAEADSGSVVTVGGVRRPQTVQFNVVVNNPTFLVGGAALGEQSSPKSGFAQLFAQLSPNSKKNAVVACLGGMPSPDRRDIASRIYPDVQHFPLLESPQTSGPCGEGVTVKEGAFDSEKSMVHDAVVEKTLFDGQLIYEGRMIHNQFSGDGCFTFNRGKSIWWQISGEFLDNCLDFKNEKTASIRYEGHDEVINGFGNVMIDFTNPDFANMADIIVSKDKRQYMMHNRLFGVFFISNGVYYGSITLGRRGIPLINGEGTFFYRDGNTAWRGNFRNGQRHGIGDAEFSMPKMYLNGKPVTEEAFDAYRKEHPEEFPKDASVSSSSATSAVGTP